jgi:hypothetical protein
MSTARYIPARERLGQQPNIMRTTTLSSYPDDRTWQPRSNTRSVTRRSVKSRLGTQAINPRTHMSYRQGESVDGYSQQTVLQPPNPVASVPPVIPIANPYPANPLPVVLIAPVTPVAPIAPVAAAVPVVPQPD